MSAVDREGVLIGRITIEKYATDDDVAVYVDHDLPLIDALALTAFATAHITAGMESDDD